MPKVKAASMMMHLRVPMGLYRQLKTKAKNEGRSVAEAAREAIRHYTKETP